MLITSDIEGKYNDSRVTHITRLEWICKNQKPRIRKIRLSDDWMNMRIYLTNFRRNMFWSNNNVEWDIGKTRYYYRKYLEREIMRGYQEYQTSGIVWDSDSDVPDERGEIENSIAYIQRCRYKIEKIKVHLK